MNQVRIKVSFGFMEADGSLISDRVCNPSLMEIFYPGNGTTTPSSHPGSEYAGVSAQSIVGMFIWFACVLYAR